MGLWSFFDPRKAYITFSSVCNVAKTKFYAGSFFNIVGDLFYIRLTCIISVSVSPNSNNYINDICFQFYLCFIDYRVC